MGCSAAAVAASPRRRRRTISAAVNAIASAAKIRISHHARDQGLVIAAPEMARMRGEGGGQRQQPLARAVGRDRDGSRDRRASRNRSDDGGRQGIGDRRRAGPRRLAPVGVGIGSQYWLKTLSGGPAQPALAELAAFAATMPGPKANGSASRKSNADAERRTWWTGPDASRPRSGDLPVGSP